MAVDKKISQLASGAPAQAGDEYVVARSGANYKLTLTNIAGNMPATTISSGNLTFSSTGQRITGDMTNATVASRLLFQTSTANSTTEVGILPNGTGTASVLNIYPNSDPSNTGYMRLACLTTDVRFLAQITGTGTYLPMTFYTGGSERMRLDTSGNLGIGRAPNYKLDAYLSGTGSPAVASSNDNIVTVLQSVGSSQGNVGTITSHPLVLLSANTERMRIDSSGNVGIGGTASAFAKVHALGTLPSSSNATQVFRASGEIPSGTTSAAEMFVTVPSTQAASFTLTHLRHYVAVQDTIGAGSTVTNQVGFRVSNTLTGATNNYGFYSDIASGANRWNFYANGTASNYFAGTNNGFGGTDAAARLVVRGVSTTSADYSLVCQNSTPATTLFVRNDGIINTGTQAASPYNNTTGSAANMFVDNTGTLFRSTSSLRYKSDVTNATHGLADVLKLRSVIYKGKNDGDKVFGGLIAEEVHDAGLTEFVAYDKEGRPDALHYGNMVALLVKAIQELSAKVAALEAK